MMIADIAELFIVMQRQCISVLLFESGVCGMEFGVINFDEELKNFKPALEVEDAEDAIYSNDAPDVTDLINMIMEKLPEKKN